MSHTPPRPQSVKTAGVLLVIAGGVGLVLCAAMAMGSLLVWVPAYTCVPIFALCAMGCGIALLANVRIPRWLAMVGASLAICQILNCDIMGLIMGIVALVNLGKPDAVAWFAGEAPLATTAGPGPGRGGPTGAAPGEIGVEFHTSFNPLAWMYAMATPRIFINGEPVHGVPWGRRFVALPPGQWQIDAHTPYLGFKAGKAHAQVHVAPASVTVVDYKPPTWWVFARGRLVASQPQHNPAQQGQWPAPAPQGGPPGGPPPGGWQG